MQQQVLSKGYENRMVIILSLAFGFVMFDRLAIANLQTFVMEDLGITYTQLGLATSVFSFSWSIVGLFGSYIADTRVSRKKLLAALVFCFSVCSMLTGMVTGFAMLLVVRLLMGAFEGPVMPVSQSFIIPQSSPHRRGMNMGLMQVSAVGLISSMLGPLIQVALAESIGWRAAFVVTIIPGIIISFLIWKFLVNPDTAVNAGETGAEKPREKINYLELFKNRNVILSLVGTLFLLCWYFCVLTYGPGYLTKVKGLTDSQMSWVMSSFGVGAILWGVLIPRLSDKYGRKPLVSIAALMGIIAPLGMVAAPASVPLLMFIAFVGWGGTGVNALMQSTIPAESGDPRFVSTIIGSNQLTGELLGATLGAILCGMVADRYGLTAVMYICAACIGVCFFIGLFYRESAPLVVARRKAAALARRNP
ncbi:MAG: MFS transporter [Acidobacteriota bacterium]|nr:MFS transporter [Acidobacteriota bacterium]NLT32181.1 MFS transporter [Acidobacteriota bacterium]